MGTLTSGQINISNASSSTVFGQGTKIQGNTIDLLNTGTLTLGSATISQIKIIPTGNLSLGSPTSTNTYIQSTNLLFGQNPESYDTTYGRMSAPSFRMSQGTGAVVIDFHTNIVNGTNFDSRIHATGGTTAEKKKAF